MVTSKDKIKRSVVLQCLQVCGNRWDLNPAADYYCRWNATFIEYAATVTKTQDDYGRLILLAIVTMVIIVSPSSATAIVPDLIATV